MAKRKKSLYLAYLEQQKAKQELESKKIKYNLDENVVVIEKNKNIVLKILILIADAISKLFKIILLVCMGILISLGCTLLFNPSLRNEILTIIGIS